LEALHWGLVGFGRVGLELPIQGFVLRAIADAGYGWVPNTVVRYSGIGSGLSFVDGSSSTTSPSFQGVASVGYTL
jgi:hypothetical protein